MDIRSEVMIPLFVLVALMVLYRVLVALELAWAKRNNRPFIRYFLKHKKLKPAQRAILETQVDFYNLLDDKNKQIFEHRVASFIADKSFQGRDDFVITDQVRVLIASTSVMLTFGMRHYKIELLEHVLVYPDVFFSTINEQMHSGEFNPRQGVLVLSWKHFIYGYQISDDNLNLGLHEMAHAMHMSAVKRHNLTTIVFNNNYQKILRHLLNPEIKDRIIQTQFFREYGFTNQFEFLAVLIEYFFESPAEFRQLFPEIFRYTRQMLSFDFAHWK